MAPLPTFDVATTDPSVLRTVARSVASPSARGDELMLIASNSAGGALALNALLGLEALGYRHALLVAYERDVCRTLGEAVRRVPARLGRDAIARTPCVWDSFWEERLAEPVDRAVLMVPACCPGRPGRVALDARPPDAREELISCPVAACATA